MKSINRKGRKEGAKFAKYKIRTYTEKIQRITEVHRENEEINI